MSKLNDLKRKLLQLEQDLAETIKEIEIPEQDPFDPKVKTFWIDTSGGQIFYLCEPIPDLYSLICLNDGTKTVRWLNPKKTPIEAFGRYGRGSLVQITREEALKTLCSQL